MGFMTDVDVYIRSKEVQVIVEENLFLVVMLSGLSMIVRMHDRLIYGMHGLFS